MFHEPISFCEMVTSVTPLLFVCSCPSEYPLSSTENTLGNLVRLGWLSLSFRRLSVFTRALRAQTATIFCCCFFLFKFRHHSPSSISLQTASHCVSSEGSLLLSIYRWGVGPVGDGIRSEHGESRPPLAARFKETGSEPRILLTFFPVWYCASLNASVLDPREKQSRCMAVPRPSSSAHSAAWQKMRSPAFGAERAEFPEVSWTRSWALGIYKYLYFPLHVTYYLVRMSRSHVVGKCKTSCTFFFLVRCFTKSDRGFVPWLFAGLGGLKANSYVQPMLASVTLE